jgi:hypothetical protein
MTIEPFRFLDLPPELRLMVYEYISIEKHRHVLTRAESGLSNDKWPSTFPSQSTITLIRPSLPVALLRTCHVIKNEATPILEEKWTSLAKQPLQFLVDYASLIALTAYPSPLAVLPYTIIPATPPTQALKDFRKSCRTFMKQKHVLVPCTHKPADGDVIDVAIFITENHNAVPEDVVARAFWELRQLCAYTEVIAAVMYKDDFLWSSVPRGSWPPFSPVVRTKGMRTPMFEERLRELERYPLLQQSLEPGRQVMTGTSTL